MVIDIQIENSNEVEQAAPVVKRKKHIFAHRNREKIVKACGCCGKEIRTRTSTSDYCYICRSQLGMM